MMARGNTFFRQSAVDAKTAEASGGYPRATCPNCGRDCAVYWPSGGDGTVRVTFWHRDAAGRWDRAEVDLDDGRFPTAGEG